MDRNMHPNEVLATVVLTVASVAFAFWSLAGVIKDEVAGAQRAKHPHRR